MKRALYSKVATIIGLDLSLQAAAVCAIPKKWDFSLREVRTAVYGYIVSNEAPEMERIKRLSIISAEITEFCRKNKAAGIGVENYAFSAMQSRAHALGEVGGTVKVKIYEDMPSLLIEPIVAASARKTLLQKLPSPKGRPKGFLKDWVMANVRRLKGPALKWTNDEVDAFVIANHMRMILDLPYLSYEGE